MAVIGNGLLGMTLLDELLNRDIPAMIFPHAALDVGIPDTLDALEGYDVTVNTAAFHSLAGCEAEPLRAHVVNADGPANVSEVARKNIFISTDYVFGYDGPHEEVVPGSAPPSIYGQTKLMGEINTLKRGGIVVRVSGLFGHRESHKGVQFPDMVVSDWTPLHVPDDQRFSPTYAPDAARRIVDIALDPYATGIYHAASSGSATWASFALEIADVAHHKRTISPTYPADKLRPKNSVLRSTRLPILRHWRFALLEWAETRMGIIRDNRVSPLRGGEG